jgi:hypothetical protein
VGFPWRVARAPWRVRVWEFARFAPYGQGEPSFET